MKQYVIYLRVSTKEQGKSGLGIEAQRRDIELYLAAYSEVPYEVLGEFCDIGSGADNGRPEFQKALALARATGAELLVAKLDRLSRKVSIIAALMDDRKLKLRVASIPNADKFQLHIYAALAEQEREFISMRTKAALSAAKARGVKLGGVRPGSMAGVERMKADADARARKVIDVIRPMREAGQTLQGIADALASMGVPTARGGKWTPMLVKRALERMI